jgi:hypothetical protein
MSVRRETLYLHEQMLLLILRDKEGTLESKAGMYRLALGGAVLIELLLNERITIDDDRKKRVSVTNPTPLGEELLDEALARMAASKRRRTASAWVSSLAGIKRLRHRIAEGLCRRKILKRSEDTVLFVFKRQVYPTLNPMPERKLLAEMGIAIRGSGSVVDSRIIILMALAHATGSLKSHFDRRTLKENKQRIEKIVSGDLVGEAAHEAVRAAVQAAVAAATLATTTTVAAR